MLHSDPQVAGFNRCESPLGAGILRPELSTAENSIREEIGDSLFVSLGSVLSFSVVHGHHPRDIMKHEQYKEVAMESTTNSSCE